MRLLILADEESWLPLPALVRTHAPDVVVTLGDLAPDVLDPLGRFAGLPVLRVYGNHDDGRYLEAANTRRPRPRGLRRAARLRRARRAAAAAARPHPGAGAAGPAARRDARGPRRRPRDHGHLVS
jgi:hypothetical protein